MSSLNIFKIFFTSFALAFAVNISTAQAETVTAEDFQLVDSSGRVTAQLTTGGEGVPGLFIYDNNHVPRVTIGLYVDQSPTIVINDDKGRATGILRMRNNNGDPVIVLKENGQDKIIIDKNGIGNVSSYSDKISEYSAVFILALIGGYMGSKFNKQTNKVDEVVAI